VQKINQAIIIAAQQHDGQMYGFKPYIHHLMDVVNNLYAYGYDDEDIICAGWLHDVLEDTAYEGDRLKVIFGEKVYALVWAVTGNGKNRKERKADMLAKLKDYPKATALKMADRLANIKNCRNTNLQLLEMYAKEMPEYVELFYRVNPRMTRDMLDLL
jgi:(p)ppGpp synthase/HD superfamily hydrolase